MRTSAPPLLPIFRSRLQGELLASLLLDPGAEYSLTELSRRHRGSLAAVQREVTRLERAGIMQSRRIGNTRLVEAATASPLHEPLARLVLLTFGPAAVIGAEFEDVDGIDALFIHGPWAARLEGEEGPIQTEVRLAVIGNPDRIDVNDAAARAERRLGREVYVTLRTPARWHSGDDRFAAAVRAGPLAPVPRRRDRDRFDTPQPRAASRP